MQIAAGSRVRARGLAWDVVDVEQCGAQQRLHLRCTGGDLHGLEWELLYPHDPIQPLHTPLRPEIPGKLTAWRLHHIACLLDQVPGPDAILSAEPGRVAIEPYQLVPLMRALEMPRPRLLLADAVGLGKTIQAGLIATELIARRRAHRILVVSPAGPLLVQWQQELRQRFGLRFTALTDSAALQRERRRIELGGNPFDSIALCLLSLDFAKQDHVLEELERTAWDLAIIDEAHHCIAAALGADRDDTQRRRLAETIARRSDGLLLLTATPHDGYDAHFASLIELLDPSLVDGRGGLVGQTYRRHVVRRLKSHIRHPRTGAPMFRDRKIMPVRIDPNGPGQAQSQAFHRALAALVAPRLRRAQRSGDYADALAFVGLLKRSVSTVAACIATLQVVAERYAALRDDAADAEALRKERARALRAWRRRRLRFGVLDAAAEAAAADLEAEDMAADLRCTGIDGAPQDDADSVVAALQALLRLGAAAEAADPKLQAMLDEVRLIRVAHPAANVLVYTEYADSQAAAVQALRGAAGITGEVLAISGLDPEAERVRVAERCADRNDIVLVSTDSMAEGLNLQQRCCHLIHLDLPYNPNRLEQRNGRIDRYGQRREPEIRYLYLAGTFEERLLLRLIAKYEKARACLDFMPDTLGVTADESAWSTGLVAGFAEAQSGLFDDDMPAVRTLDAAVAADNAAALRDLLHEIDRAFEGYERHAARHGWLAEQGVNADLRQVGAADAARQRSDALLGHIDLPDFVAAVIAAETAPPPAPPPGPPPGPARDARTTRPPTPPAVASLDGRQRGDSPAIPNPLALPPAWAAGLDDLPGYEARTGTLRLTRDRNRLCDAEGAPLAFLGRAHPLVQRAIAHARRCDLVAADTSDARVGVASWDRHDPAALLTFSIEMDDARRVALQRVIAVLLPRIGPAIECAEPEHWLRLATNDPGPGADRAWQRWFAPWLSRRHAEADQLAATIMQRQVEALLESRQRDADLDRTALDHWISLRADDLCGAYLPRCGDLFGTVPDGPAWKFLSAPLDRLAALASDPDVAPTRRREAGSAVTVFRRHQDQRADQHAAVPPRLRPIGMLMLVPAQP